MSKYSKQIEAAVSEFMGSKRVAWATPGSSRHSSNFYGDTWLCRFTKSELVQCVECYWENYADQIENIEAAISDILADMQLDKPDEN